MADFAVLPDGSRERRLLKPIETHTGFVEVVRLRQPRYRDIMRLGDPSSLIVMNGAVLPQQDMSIVSSYIETLLVDQGGQPMMPVLLEQCDYRDALALKEAVLDFFKAASASTSTGTPTP